MDKTYFAAVEKKLEKQGKSPKEIAAYLKKLVSNEEEPERDQPEITNHKAELEDEE